MENRVMYLQNNCYSIIFYGRGGSGPDTIHKRDSFGINEMKHTLKEGKKKYGKRGKTIFPDKDQPPFPPPSDDEDGEPNDGPAEDGSDSDMDTKPPAKPPAKGGGNGETEGP